MQIFGAKVQVEVHRCDPTDNAISRDAAKSRPRERSNGVGGDPCDKLIFIASWVAALSIGR